MSQPARRAIARFAVTAVLIVVVAYPLSYAPYIRCRYGPSQATDEMVSYDLDAEYFSRRHHAVYAPVEWMIDETSLQEPMMSWAEIWGADDKIDRDSLSRRFRRALKQDRNGR